MNSQLISEWKPQLGRVIDSKVNELIYLGYNEATNERVWQCLLKKVWKKDGEMALHQIVEDILHLKPHIFMSYMTQLAYQSDDLEGAIADVLSDLDA